MKNLMKGFISLSYTDHEINEFDNSFQFFAIFSQLKIEIESLIPITSIIIHLLVSILYLLLATGFTCFPFEVN